MLEPIRPRIVKPIAIKRPAAAASGLSRALAGGRRTVSTTAQLVWLTKLRLVVASRLSVGSLCTAPRGC